MAYGVEKPLAEPFDPSLAYPPTAPPPPYAQASSYWDPCGDYLPILEESWKFFCHEMGQEWGFKKQEKFLRIETLKSAKYKTSGIRISGDLKSTNKPGFQRGSALENLKYQLYGIDSLKETPSVDAKTIRLIAQPSHNTNVHTYVEKFPWPMTNREYLTLQQMKQDPTTRNFMIIGTPVTLPGVPISEKPIRAMEEYLYVLEPSKLDPNVVHGTFYLFYELNGSLSANDQESGMKDIVKLFLELPKYI